MYQLLPWAIGGLVGLSWWKRSQNQRGMTAERRVLLDTLINTPQTPATLKTMADAYEKEGLKSEAATLRKKAALRELPDDVKERRKQVFRDAMKSSDPAAVLSVAAAFEKEGYTGNAAALREYAASLKKAAQAAPKAAAKEPPAPASPPPPPSSEPEDVKPPAHEEVHDTTPPPPSAAEDVKPPEASAA